MDETERDRLMGAAQILAKGCCGVSVTGERAVDPSHVQQIARSYVAQRLADVAEQDANDWPGTVVLGLFVLGSIASIVTLVLTAVKF